MNLLKSVYKVFRSIVMSLIVLLVIVYLGLYVVLSIPAVQNGVKEKVAHELSTLTGGNLEIGNLAIYPFSEVMMTDISLTTPDGDKCAGISRLAAGIDIWKLMTDGRIVLNYAEIIGLNLEVVQVTKESSLNIQFLIDALSPKDKDKPSALFDVRIRNIVVRDSRATFSRLWLKNDSAGGFNASTIKMTGLRMDLSIPVLRNDLFTFDIRNIQCDVTPGVSVQSLSALVSYKKGSDRRESDRLIVRNFEIELPKSRLSVGDFELDLKSLNDIGTSIDGHLTPSDLQTLVPVLEGFNTPWNIVLDASLKGKSVMVSELKLEEAASNSMLSLIGEVRDYSRKDSLDIELKELTANLSSKLISEVLVLVPKADEKLKKAVRAAGSISLELEGSMKNGDVVDAEGRLITDGGGLDFETTASGLYSHRPKFKLAAEAVDVNFGKFLSTEKMGKASLNIEADMEGYGRNAEGRVHVTSNDCELLGNRLTDIDLELSKVGKDLELTLDALSEGSSISADGMAVLQGSETRIDLDMDVAGFNPSAFGLKGKSSFSDISGQLKLSSIGNNVDNLTGKLELENIGLTRPDGEKLVLSKMTVVIEDVVNSGSYTYDKGVLPKRDIRIDSDWLEARISGILHPSSIGDELKRMVGTVFPALLSESGFPAHDRQVVNDFTFDINIKGAAKPYVFFDTPFRPLTDIPIRGFIDGPGGKANISIYTPHLQQGKNKLIRDVSVNANLDAFLGMARISAGLIFPAKKGDAELAADIYAVNDKVKVDLGINPTMASSVKGGLSFSAGLSRIPDPFRHNGVLAVDVEILPSKITVNEKDWNIANGTIDYSGKRVAISNFLINHDDQYVKIDGVASESPADHVKVRLNDIDLEYIFNILNINYVSFGGMATGEVSGSRLLTKYPEARTEYLRVNGLSYNGAVLGDGDLASDYDASQHMVGIFAVIRDPLTRHRRVSVDGGIWVTKDSISFDFDADKVNVGIMKPFVSAFCSDLYGAASGKCKLYGTFSDIDLVGDLKADTLSMKLDFTNTWYHAGNDSVFLHKGTIEIPPLSLYDDFGHSAEFSGWLRHRYFHEPSFSFRLKDAKSLLCYDTNAQINPLWYGTIFGSGHAQINGHPGMIDIDMNMTTEEGSKFYYIISDAEDVAQYSFLTFTDKRKEQKEAVMVDTVPEYLKKFRKQVAASEEGSSNVILSLKGTVTNDALVTLVMDPKAGDNITARGQGALQMDYNLAGNDLRMMGTYVLDEGNYNFTLQDIIIKNFNIRKGSLIKFNGDPMNANLDITATYRVNTNLTDLDESFANDKELNRTNVPVDAVLKVAGPMTNPDITFDIELPSLTSDVERKVKSIVSTNDMMSRQIIYLLAMNRFYTPEYTAGSKGQGSGSEWSSLASSTISSQLSNILSQMTDKLDVAPSFRSDKGDFTDMQFDLALSSRLLNNRLLINGNFGYRDKNTSNTQFIGDFDIEYLLSKNGNLRLKAYNHFNDQNYYLRSALTTQGVGVVFRRDFDRLFRRRKIENKESAENPEEPADSIKDGIEEIMSEKENK